MDYRISITAGVGEDANGVKLAKDTVESGLANIRYGLTRRAGGYTETAVEGGWMDPHGRVVTEPGRRFTIMAPSAAPAREYADFIGHELHQRAVAVEVEALQLAHVFEVES